MIQQESEYKKHIRIQNESLFNKDQEIDKMKKQAFQVLMIQNNCNCGIRLLTFQSLISQNLLLSIVAVKRFKSFIHFNHLTE